jgi:glycogen(starch) synthase
MLWSVAAAKIIERFCQKNNPDNAKKVVAHFHEWLAGFGLLYLKKQNVKVGTVFTTHATMLGRTLAGSGVALYDVLGSLNPDKEAYAYGVQDKYTTEKACALNADVFTTVSEITSIEAEKILSRKADVLLLNGLDIEKFPTYEECAIKHRENRDIIRNFVSYYFFPHYYFDLKETLFFFIVGRYEYKNKGLDIFVKALAKLNDRMKAENIPRTVVAFFWIPREVHGAKTEISVNKVNFNRMKEFMERNTPHLKHRVMDNLMKCDTACFNSEEGFNKGGLFDKGFLFEAKRLKLSFEKKGNPLLVTHNLPFEENDIIIRNMLDTGLDNKEDDKVKVIFYPVYLTGVDGLIDLPYYEAITGCHLGLFPSYYEPWGYTPLESAALGVPALTTDLGGFGRFLLDKGTTDNGVFILKRFGIPEEETINHFADILYNYTKLDEKGRVKQKILAKEIANLADWKELIMNYFEAHNKAVDKVWGN